MGTADIFSAAIGAVIIVAVLWKLVSGGFPGKRDGEEPNDGSQGVDGD